MIKYVVVYASDCNTNPNNANRPIARTPFTPPVSKLEFSDTYSKNIHSSWFDYSTTFSVCQALFIIVDKYFFCIIGYYYYRDKKERMKL